MRCSFRFIFNHRAGFLPFARGDQIMRYFAGNTAVKFRSRGDTAAKLLTVTGFISM